MLAAGSETGQGKVHFLDSAIQQTTSVRYFLLPIDADFSPAIRVVKK
jgi:hypothetical protein